MFADCKLQGKAMSALDSLLSASCIPVCAVKAVTHQIHLVHTAGLTCQVKDFLIELRSICSYNNL